MGTTSSYQAIAQAYVNGVQGLFVTPGIPTTERGERKVAPSEDLADRATLLSPVSANLTRATVSLLADTDPAVRAQASTKLLVKALTDLEVSVYLLQVAEDEESGNAYPGNKETARGTSSFVGIEERLQLLLSEDALDTSLSVRGLKAPASIPRARLQLSNLVSDALTLIVDRASKTGLSALSGLLGLGAAELAQAAGVVGLNIAQVLGQAEMITRLYNLFREFVIHSYNSLLALIGQQVAQTVAKQVLEWVNELKYGKLFGDLLEKLYETQQMAQDLSQIVAHSQVHLEKFVTAIEGVDELNNRYRQQMDLIEKFLKGVRILGGISVAVLPMSKLLVAAAYIMLAGYVIFTGADYVDAQRLKLLDRVPGVRQVVEINLAGT